MVISLFLLNTLRSVEYLADQLCTTHLLTMHADTEVFEGPISQAHLLSTRSSSFELSNPLHLLRFLQSNAGKRVKR